MCPSTEHHPPHHTRLLRGPSRLPPRPAPHVGLPSTPGSESAHLAPQASRPLSLLGTRFPSSLEIPPNLQDPTLMFLQIIPQAGISGTKKRMDSGPRRLRP